MFDLIWFGHKATALFDFWSIQHFLTGIVLGYVCLIIEKDSKGVLRWSFLMILFILSWELFELGMELGVFGGVLLEWMVGLEYWPNRFIVDPLLVFSGGLVYINLKSKKLIYLVSVIVFLWFFINLLSPDTMYIQNYLMK